MNEDLRNKIEQIVLGYIPWTIACVCGRHTYIGLDLSQMLDDIIRVIDDSN